MPYCDRLRSFNDWFTQMWAESLGKEGIGLTPLTAIGASGQHSQMQLFMDGPRDKFFLFIQIQELREEGEIRCQLPYPSFQALRAASLGELLRHQLAGTLMAMDELEIPYALLTLQRPGEWELGQLIMFFQLLTTLVGDRLQLNPFNQPGVERCKRNAFQLLDENSLKKT